jgi:hypothetical protein
MKKLILVAALALSAAATPAHALGYDLDSFVGADKLEKICAKDMVCRKFEGTPCQISKNFFSACYTLCNKAQADFGASQCVAKAVKAHTFDPAKGVYTKGTTVQNEKPAAHLARQIMKAAKANAKVKAGMTTICNGLVKAKSLAAKLDNGTMAGFEKACFTGLGIGKAPAASAIPADMEASLEAPADPNANN